MGIISLIKGIGANTLFYPGCMLKFGMEKELENYKQIFNLLGIDFVMIPEELCCGSPVYNAGYKKEYRKLAEKNFELFKKHNITRILTPCPGCYNMFKNEYPKLIREWNIETEHATRVILAELKKKRIKGRASEEIVSYHDPCHLGRFSNIYEEPREVITLLGGRIKEMKNNREKALCCGGGGGLRANYPELAKKIAMKRVSGVPADVIKIITPCGLCASNLKTADDRATEFSEWVLERIKLVY